VPPLAAQRSALIASARVATKLSPRPSARRAAKVSAPSAARAAVRVRSC